MIRGEEVVGLFESYEKALEAGYHQSDLAPFLMKKVERVETIYRFSRPI